MTYGTERRDIIQSAGLLAGAAAAVTTLTEEPALAQTNGLSERILVSHYAPHGALADATARDFGSTDRWWTEVAAMGKAEGGGSGCAVLAYSPRDKRLINQWAADYTTTLADGRPVLVLDISSICTSISITWISAPRPHSTSTPIWKRSAGTMR